MIKLQIKEDEWKEFSEVEVQPNTPYWFKQTNGNVVLSAHLTKNGSSGWSVVRLSEEGVLQMSGNEFYLLRGAKLQPALINENPKT